MRKEQLEFGTEYKVVRFTLGSTPIHFEDIPTRIQTPMEPARIEKCTNRMLNAARTELVVSLEGRKLRANLGFLSLSAESGSWKSIGGIEADDDTHCSVRFLTGDAENTTHIKFGKEYTLKTISADESNFVVNDGIIVRVPFPPKITRIKCMFVDSRKTSCIVVLTGTDLIVGNSLNVTLNDSLSVIASITSETEGRTNGISIGMNGMLKYGTTYEITSLEPTNVEDGVILFEHLLLFTTEENRIVELFVSEGGIDSTADCEVFAAPCSSIVVGWKGGAERGGSEGVVLRIVDSARFGGGIWVGQSRLEIGSVFWGESWVEVEEGWDGKGRRREWWEWEEDRC
ncbi:hypothetical protein BLNAU_3224 [Blattamonas nauphoetae]|uniref:Uncharacterized protein n=1 Tax=Blattamonas nauphoetae TaxID=2049346 RepID=A0ABQ9YDF2_9EUKA|nr:hypothetical protein BLNAU_3224 [Blattamonas nauphoetae]